VILDWSGTTVDCGGFGSIPAFLEAFQENWVEITAQEVRAHAGLSYSDRLLALLQSESVSEKWIDVYGAPPSEFDLDRMYRAIERLMPSHVADHAEPVTGMLEAVSEFRRRELKIGSTSTHSYAAMEALAEAARERGYEPDTVVCSSDVPAGRPFPWMCYQNAINLEIYPMQSLVKIGDTLPDILEGLNADMWTIGVTKTSACLGKTEEEIARADKAELGRELDRIGKMFLDAGAHFVVESIRDCPGIIDRINQRLKLGETP
jgi:phosphonoacetaldehyde hydrolase